MGSLKLVKPSMAEPEEERTLQKSYWTDHSLEASVEAMMLDSQAKVIDREERPEVRPLRVLELPDIVFDVEKAIAGF